MLMLGKATQGTSWKMLLIAVCNKAGTRGGCLCTSKLGDDSVANDTFRINEIMYVLKLYTTKGSCVTGQVL